MYTIDELWNSFTSINKLRQDWADNEGKKNNTHQLLDQACQSAYDILVERFQQTRKFAPCGGCSFREDKPEGEFIITEWHCGVVYRDNIADQVCGEFYCKDCGCLIRVNEKGEDPYDVFRNRNLPPL